MSLILYSIWKTFLCALVLCFNCTEGRQSYLKENSTSMSEVILYPSNKFDSDWLKIFPLSWLLVKMYGMASMVKWWGGEVSWWSQCAPFCSGQPASGIETLSSCKKKSFSFKMLPRGKVLGKVSDRCTIKQKIIIQTTYFISLSPVSNILKKNTSFKIKSFHYKIWAHVKAYFCKHPVTFL